MRIKKIANTFFSLRVTGILFVIFAVAMAVATFIENDFGTPVAKAWIYNATWFEILFALMVLNLIGSFFKYQMLRRGRWPMFLFHLGLIFIVLGGGLTRFFGFEGSMHIREGKSVNNLTTYETFLTIKTDHSKYEEQVIFAKNLKNHFHATVNDVSFELLEFVPNAVESLMESSGGIPVITFSIITNGQSQLTYIQKNRAKKLLGQTFSFGFPLQDAIHFKTENETIYIKSSDTLFVVGLDGTKSSYPPETYTIFKPKKLYQSGDSPQISIGKYYPSAQIFYETNVQNQQQFEDALRIKATAGNESAIIQVRGAKGIAGKSVYASLGNHKIEIKYGSQIKKLPFSLTLKDFILERYPGSMSPSSYESIVVVNDPKQPESQPYRIFMNNVLKHRGYRFYQSSYDPDEHGTILSVNHDLPGTVVTYIGYFLLSFGMLVSLFAPKSRFQFLTRRSKHLRTKPLLLILIALLTGNNLKAEESSYLKTIDYEHARKFGTLLVQDKQGRVKPVSALSGALLRKITRKAQFQGLHPDQVFLGMITAPQKWKRVPMIKISNDNLAKTLGIKGKYGAFTDFVDEQRGVYHLKKWVETAYEKKPAQRNTFDKEVMKVDERVNIFFLITRMEFTNFFPVPKHPHQKWLNYPATAENPLIYENNTARRLFSAYLSALHEATQTGHYQEADRLLERLKYHQSHYGAEIIPSVQKQQAEIWYNDANLFVRLGIVYGAAGFILFIVILIRIMSNRKINWLYLPITGILIITFLAHIAGLALRWYISDHAPWSDGYESMIYIGFATMAAGFIFMKNTPLALSAASILAAITLLVAHLSWMDPEITNLVPVLKSYWLTIHVSVITGSYGFLALGALMGLFNLILYTLKNEQNTRFIDQKIEQLSLVNEMTLTIGLYMLTIGTFLGGVWANESWGRYWGWDPKETWALISVIVYAFILHMRLIPGLGGRFLFNLASLVGFGSILMTYFGVNFYLSGLHSYAKGDPMPIPDFVYFTLAVITVITVAGFLNQRRLNTKSIPHDVDS